MPTASCCSLLWLIRIKACWWKIDTHTHLYMSLQELDLYTQPTYMLALGSSHLQLHSAQTHTCTNGSLSRPLYFVLHQVVFLSLIVPLVIKLETVLSSTWPRDMTPLIPVSQVTCSPHRLSSLTFTSNHALKCINFFASIAVTLRLQSNCGTEIPHMHSSTLAVEFTTQHMS